MKWQIFLVFVLWLADLPSVQAQSLSPEAYQTMVGNIVSNNRGGWEEAADIGMIYAQRAEKLQRQADAAVTPEKKQEMQGQADQAKSFSGAYSEAALILGSPGT